MAVIMKCSMQYIIKHFERIANNLTSILMLFHTMVQQNILLMFTKMRYKIKANEKYVFLF